jgi:hypothetical protein
MEKDFSRHVVLAIGGGEGRKPGGKKRRERKKKRGGDKIPIGRFHAKNMRTRHWDVVPYK